MNKPNVPVYDIFSTINSETNVLIGGATGSGKSVFEDGMLYNLFATSTPDEVEVYLIDPKIVQLRKWVSMPHVKGYADSIEEANLLLDLVKIKMMKRYDEMADEGLDTYEGSAVYVFIDELADLILEDKNIVKKLQKLLQLCRAANIHIVCCSQSVSRVTVPAVLQVNFTARVGLRTADAIDSRQIIKQAGCEALPRYGFCILNTPDGVEKRPFPMYSQEKINALKAFWREQRKAVVR